MNQRIPTRPHTEIEVGGADGVTVFPTVLSAAERDRLIGTIEFIIEKLKHGLAMPPDPDALAYYEDMLRRVHTSYSIPGKAPPDEDTQGDRR